MIRIFLYLFLTSILGSAYAENCENTQTLVCEGNYDETIYTNVCISNKEVASYLASNPDSTYGDCALFDINKVKVYSCNAGLKFAPKKNLVCIKRDQDNATAPTCGESNDCVCNNDNSQEESAQSFFKFSIGNYHPKVATQFTPKTIIASYTNTFASASISTNGAYILEDGSALSFNLGSDFYGAEYFVDICIQNKNLSPERFDLTYAGKVLFTNSIFSSSNYNLSSKLYNKVDINCTGGSGDQTSQSLIANGPFYQAEKSYTRSISGARFCALRHHYSETESVKLREHKLRKITIQKQLSVLPTDLSLLEPTEVHFCKIKKNKNKYTCSPMIFLGTEGLRNSGSSIDDDTFSGSCPNPCKLK